MKFGEAKKRRKIFFPLSGFSMLRALVSLLQPENVIASVGEFFDDEPKFCKQSRATHNLTINDVYVLRFWIESCYPNSCLHSRSVGLIHILGRFTT